LNRADDFLQGNFLNAPVQDVAQLQFLADVVERKEVGGAAGKRGDQVPHDRRPAHGIETTHGRPL
jgi:hypothetical protein